MDYYIVKKTTENQIEIKKSLFISYLIPVQSPDEAKKELDELWQKHPKATHVCWAYYFGDQISPVCTSSDDGEPRGTAGKPILEVMIQNRLRNAVLAVVRYFGGIKLGAGGLVRAYTGSAADLIRKSTLLPDIAFVQKTLNIGYDKFDAFRIFCSENSIEIIEESFAEQVCVVISYAETREIEFPYGMILNF